MVEVPGDGHACPVGLIYITRGLLDLQVPLEPCKLELRIGCTAVAIGSHGRELKSDARDDRIHVVFRRAVSICLLRILQIAALG